MASAEQKSQTWDASGKTVVVTGASAGIGAAAARRLAACGADVVPVGRTPEKTERVAEEIAVEPELCDFAELSQVRDLADRLLARCPQIDVLAQNAGGYWTDGRRTGDGYELMVQVNHLAPFLLQHLLEQRLRESAARVVWTSSVGHRFGSAPPEDPALTDQRFAQRRYGSTKLQNALVAQETHRRWRTDGVVASSFHPGAIASDFGRDDLFASLLYRSPLGRFFESPEDGADTLVWLAVAPEAGDADGDYFTNRKKAPVNSQLEDPRRAETLWESTERLLGLS